MMHSIAKSRKTKPGISEPDEAELDEREPTKAELREEQKLEKRRNKQIRAEAKAAEKHANQERRGRLLEARRARTETPESEQDSTTSADTSEMTEEEKHAQMMARRAEREARLNCADGDVRVEYFYITATGDETQLPNPELKGNRCEQAATSEPLPDCPKADAQALASFRKMVLSGNAPWLTPEQVFDPTDSGYNTRTARGDARAKRNASAIAEALPDGDSKSMAEKVGRSPRASRGERSVRASIARGNGIGVQR